MKFHKNFYRKYVYKKFIFKKKKMDKEKNIKKEDFVNNKELVVLLDNKINNYLNLFHKNFVELCKDKNGIQNEENFFKLSSIDQMKFNECIDDVSKKVKKDFSDLEKFYSKCKLICYDKYDKFTLDSSIDEYVNSYVRIYNNAHPCIIECMDLYSEFTHRYFNYMVEGIKIYLVFYKKIELNKNLFI